MANKLIVWPVGGEAGRNAYADEADAQWKIITGNPSAIWTYRREDGLGRPYCAYLGPPQTYGGVVVEAPPSCEALRGDGEVVDLVPPPDEEE